MKSINIVEYKNFLKLKLSKVVPEEYFDNYFNAFTASYNEIINTVKKDENILDVGCGGGLLVNYLDVCGYKIEGFDNYLYNPHTKAINEVVNDKGLVKNSNIKDFNFRKKYDVIFMSNVIEHINDWEENLNILMNYLNPSGRIILLLPNYSVPVEPHFMLPIIYNKEITYKIFKNKIMNHEKIHNRKGIWESLNFIKLKDLKKFNFFPIELKVGDICLFNWKCAHYSENNQSNKSRMIFYATFCKKNKDMNLRKMYYLDKQSSYNNKKNKSLLFT